MQWWVDERTDAVVDGGEREGRPALVQKQRRRTEEGSGTDIRKI